MNVVNSPDGGPITPNGTPQLYVYFKLPREGAAQVRARWQDLAAQVQRDMPGLRLRCAQRNEAKGPTAPTPTAQAGANQPPETTWMEIYDGLPAPHLQAAQHRLQVALDAALAVALAPLPAPSRHLELFTLLPPP